MGKIRGSLAPQPSRREEHFLKGTERSSSGKNQNRDEAAVCCDVTKQNQRQPSGCVRVWIGCNLCRGGNFILGAALRLSPALFLPLPFPQPEPYSGKGSLGSIYMGLAIVCQEDIDKWTHLNYLLQTALFEAKMMVTALIWLALLCVTYVCIHMHTQTHTCTYLWPHLV